MGWTPSITKADWIANDKHFRKAYAPTNTIKVVWWHIENAVTYTDAISTPYSSKQIIDNAYQLVFNTDMFASNCWKWNKRAAGNKTLRYLKIFFAASHQELRLLLQNKTGAPYVAAHNSTANPYDRCLHQDTVDAIANLTMATASDRKAIAQLTSTAMVLTMEIATVNENLVVTLQAKCASRSIQVGSNKSARRRGVGAGAAAKTRAGSPALSETAGGVNLELPIHYCWTCGPGCMHNSSKYPKPTARKIYTDTKRDMQGGEEAPH